MNLRVVFGLLTKYIKQTVTSLRRSKTNVTYDETLPRDLRSSNSTQLNHFNPLQKSFD